VLGFHKKKTNEGVDQHPNTSAKKKVFGGWVGQEAQLVCVRLKLRGTDTSHSKRKKKRIVFLLYFYLLAACVRTTSGGLAFWL